MLDDTKLGQVILYDKYTVKIQLNHSNGYFINLYEIDLQAFKQKGQVKYKHVRFYSLRLNGLFPWICNISFFFLHKLEV